MLAADPPDSDWRGHGVFRLESGYDLSIFGAFSYGVVRVLSLAGDRIIAIAMGVAMQLQDRVRRDGDVIVAFVDRIKHIAIAGYLAFVAVRRLWFIGHQFAQPLVGSRYVLNLVRSGDALILCDLDQAIERIGSSRLVEGSLATVFFHVIDCSRDFGCHHPEEPLGAAELFRHYLRCLGNIFAIWFIFVNSLHHQ